jgi:hypothetical protein
MVKFTILGERCSGTNYLQELLRLNFYNVQTEGSKHWFKNPRPGPTIGIIRNPIDWLYSLYTCLHNIPDENKTLPAFLLNEYYSVQNNEIITQDLKVKYHNIFELRFLKNKFLLEIEKPDYILISYDELKSNPSEVLLQIKNKFRLQFKGPVVDVNYYVGWGRERGVTFIKRKVDFSPEILKLIQENLDKEQEFLLGYKLSHHDIFTNVY